MSRRPEANALPRGETAAALVRWSGAGLMALALHGAPLIWLIQPPPRAENAVSPPPAIMIAFAQTPEAVKTERNDISAERKNARESQAAREAQTPETPTTADAPAEKARRQPVEKSPAARPMRQTAQKVEPAAHRARLPVPVGRQTSRRPDTPVRRAKDTPPSPSARQAQTASKAAIQAQATVTPARRDAARQATAGVQASPQAMQTWQSRLMARLERYKKYPPGARARKETGIVYVRFSLNASGQVLSVELARSSGFGELDREVLALVHRASPLPAPPQNAPGTLTAPVEFTIK